MDPYTPKQLDVALDSIRWQPTIVLTSYKRDGTAVPTPVNPLFDGHRILVITFSRSGKIKRIKHDARVKVLPSTFKGKATGPEIAGAARILEGERADRAYELFRRDCPMSLMLAGLRYRGRGGRIAYIEVIPTGVESARGVPTPGGAVKER